LFKRNADSRFEREVLGHLDSGYNLACWLLGNGPDADDALQCASIKAHQSIQSLRGENVKPWFLAIVRNECLNLLRGRASREKRESRLEDWDFDENAQDPETVVLARIEAKELKSAIEALPPAHREAIVLREMEDMSYAEIAAVTKVPIGTVMSRLARARTALSCWRKAREEAL